MLKQEIWVDGSRVLKNYYGRVMRKEYYEDINVTFPDIGNPTFESTAPQQPLDWCNSAGVELLPEEDEIRLNISVGDPRGAFVMSIRRTADGRLLMHIPHPKGIQPHAPLRTIAEGTYAIFEEDAAATS